MAKKKPATKKKETAKKGQQQSGGKKNPVAVGAILVLIFGIIFYGLNETGKFAGEPEPASQNVSRPAAKPAPEQREEKKSVKKPAPQAKIDPTDIASKDGLTERKTTNENLPEYANTEKYYYTSSFDFSWPSYSQSDAIVEHQYYTVAYDEKNEQARWIAYSLTAENLSNAQFKRKDNFKSDPDVITGSATLEDYKKSGYDRGHLAPAADFTWTEDGLDESFYMSNMSPQVPGFNRGIWKVLEEQVRTWAKANHKLYIVTGPIVGKRPKKIGKNKVSVPEYYYKAILDIQEPELKAIGFILKNEKSSEDIMSFALSIDELEQQTGLDFFPLIPDDLEEKLESELNKSLWK